ncbi:MAG: gamma-glutamyl-phosphate reductase, partial [Paludibacteraceae bacterium]|nr:gamma-glutamyl-phosphate reductase [Paludibacteraceae bacterium]
MEQNWKELALEASRRLNRVSGDDINSVLLDVADAAEAASFLLLKANEQDLAKMDKSNPMYDRLMLTEERIKGIAADMRKVASLPSPLDRVLEERTLPNGLHLVKRSVPFGVIGIIYEA